MSKMGRHRTILEVIGQESISNQETLRKILDKSGFSVTQATLSRDLKELSVVKTPTGDGRYKYTQLDRSPDLPVRSCQASGNLLVMHTEAGMAGAVAYRIDELGLKEIVGTVAGEDTLLAVVAEGCDAQKVREDLCRRVRAV